MDRRKRYSVIFFCVAIGALGWTVFRVLWHEEAVKVRNAAFANTARLKPAVLPARQEDFVSMVPPVLKNVDKNSDALLYERWKQDIVTELSSRNDADSLMTAALLLNALRGSPRDISSSAKVLSLLQRAGELAPQDPAVQSALMLFCQSVPDCDIAPYEATMQALEPKNGFGWVVGMSRAIEKKDDNAPFEGLQRMAQVEDFDFHHIERARRMVRTLDQLRIPPPSEIASADYLHLRDSIIYDSFNAVVLPQMITMIDECGQGAIESQRAACIRIGVAMERSDSFLVRVIGDSILQQGVLPNAVESVQIEDTRRQIAWVRSRIHRVPPMTPSEWTRLETSSTSDMEAMQKWIGEHGLPERAPER